MSNVLSNDKQHQVLALGRLGWSLRRIQQATGVRRETASGYLKAAGVQVRQRGGRPRSWPPANPATTPGVSTDPVAPNAATTSEASTDPTAASPATTPEVSTESTVAPPAMPEFFCEETPSQHGPTASACEPYRHLIEDAVGLGRNAMAIWQDLVDKQGFPAQYASAKRFVGKLRGPTAPDARVAIITAPGEEAQVEYGDGPMDLACRPSSSAPLSSAAPVFSLRGGRPVNPGTISQTFHQLVPQLGLSIPDGILARRIVAAHRFAANPGLRFNPAVAPPELEQGQNL